MIRLGILSLALLVGEAGFLMLVRRWVRRADVEIGAAETPPRRLPDAEPDELLHVLELRVKGAARAAS